MHRKNVAGQGQYLAAYDTGASPVVGKTGDASNITGAWSKDGGAETSGFTTAHPTEIGGGIYWQPWSQAESNGTRIANRWVSSTSGVVIDPVFSDAIGQILDEVNTGATHNVADSVGKQLRAASSNTDVIYPLSGTVNLTAATSTTATLDAGASAVAQAYQWDVIEILTGTGAGQSRVISNYTTGRVATVIPAWSTTPDTSSTFQIAPTASVQVVSYIAGQDPATLVLATPATANRLATDTSGRVLLQPTQTGVTIPNVTTVTTTTNLTNLPTIPNNWLTAAGIASGALNGKGDWLTTGGDVNVISFAAGALAQFFTTDTGEQYAAPYSDAVNGSVVKEIVSGVSATVIGGGGGTVDANLVSINGTTFDGPNAPSRLAADVTHSGTLSASIMASFFVVDSGERFADPYNNAVSGSVVAEIVDNVGADLATVAAAVDALLTTNHGAGLWTAASGDLTTISNLLTQVAGDVTTILTQTENTLDETDIRNAIGLTTNNLDEQLAAIPTAAENADKVLGRNLEGGSDGGRDVREALYFLRNKWAIVGGILTVCNTSDQPSWTAVASQNSSTPVTGIDP